MNCVERFLGVYVERSLIITKFLSSRHNCTELFMLFVVPLELGGEGQRDNFLIYVLSFLFSGLCTLCLSPSRSEGTCQREA